MNLKCTKMKHLYCFLTLLFKYNEILVKLVLFTNF